MAWRRDFGGPAAPASTRGPAIRLRLGEEGVDGTNQGGAVALGEPVDRHDAAPEPPVLDGGRDGRLLAREPEELVGGDIEPRRASR